MNLANFEKKTIHEQNSDQREADAVFLEAIKEAQRKRDYIVVGRTVPRPLASNPFMEPVNLSKHVISSVGYDFEKTYADIISPDRDRELCNVRFIIYKLLHEWGYPTAKIGRLIGRDHTTVMHGLKQFAVWYDRDARVRKSYDNHKELMAQALGARAAA